MSSNPAKRVKLETAPDHKLTNQAFNHGFFKKPLTKDKYVFFPENLYFIYETLEKYVISPPYIFRF